MPDVNIPLLRKAVEWAEAEAAKPVAVREWHQGAWVTTPEDFEEEFGRGVKSTECGTCFCIAGFVASQTLRPGEKIVDGYGITAEGAVDLEYVEDRAANELGLGFTSAGLFHADNTIEDVRRIAEEIAGERL